MHTPNHLLSPEVSLLGGAVALTLLGVAISKVSRDPSTRAKGPLAITLGAFVFALQMLNFAIGDVGCSGHLIGGILLAALLGKWLGFVTLSGVLLLQALLFADGGIMTLGWNILNMSALGCLVAYPLVFMPIIRRGTSAFRLFVAGTLSSILAVELGALGIVAESAASGSALPTWEFMGFMLPVHLIIGAIEGVITGVILALVGTHQPAMVDGFAPRSQSLRVKPQGVIAGFALSALLLGGVFSLMASERPDGLEWSISRSLDGSQMVASHPMHTSATRLQESMAVAPDYEGDYTGLLTTAGILLLAWVGRKRIEN